VLVCHLKDMSTNSEKSAFNHLIFIEEDALDKHRENIVFLDLKISEVTFFIQTNQLL
jgi:hypothetical protein